MAPEQGSAGSTVLEVAIIGGGFAGLGMGWHLKQAGIDSFLIFEKSSDIGGVWRENTYPGAACDVPSHLYSFSFEPHYPWSCRYGKQAEILEYQHHVARKYDLERHFRFGREVSGAQFDEQRGLWQVRFTGGATCEARVLVSAVGQLHRPAYPNIPGLQRFTGRAFHSARWDHGCSLRGKTVAVIGTGASAVQFVPEIARQAARLYVFQRSPGWCIPKFDRRFAPWEQWLLRRFPVLYDLDRRRIFWLIEFLASAMLGRSLAGSLADALLKLQARLLLRAQVPDPRLRRRLTPDYPIGCKRILLSNDWLRTLASDRVELVTEPIAEVTATGPRTTDGRLRQADVIVYGTGFAASQFLAPMELKGSDGRFLHDRWMEGADAYLGVAVSGFPNFFMLYGPNTNLGAGSIIYMLEAQARYIARCVELLRQRGLRSMEVRAEAQGLFAREMHRRSHSTSYEAGCHSWYTGPDGRNTNNWVGHMSEYGRRLRQPRLEDYALIPADQRAVPA
ncbi:MAG: NAD(P)/FAD-dependent oxidoreductase [Nevskia sp.]|nr:NAD(P)/FAD-dependent oxidoreductase [Nevskia sp.]